MQGGSILEHGILGFRLVIAITINIVKVIVIAITMVLAPMAPMAMAPATQINHLDRGPGQ